MDKKQALAREAALRSHYAKAGALEADYSALADTHNADGTPKFKHPTTAGVFQRDQKTGALTPLEYHPKTGELVPKSEVDALLKAEQAKESPADAKPTPALNVSAPTPTPQPPSAPGSGH